MPAHPRLIQILVAVAFAALVSLFSNFPSRTHQILLQSFVIPHELASQSLTAGKPSTLNTTLLSAGDLMPNMRNSSAPHMPGALIKRKHIIASTLVACFAVTMMKSNDDHLKQLAQENTARMYHELTPYIKPFLAITPDFPEAVEIWKAAGNNYTLHGLSLSLSLSLGFIGHNLLCLHLF